MRQKQRLTVVSDDAVLWIAAGLALAAAIVFNDYLRMPQKWHAAIMWTIAAFEMLEGLRAQLAVQLQRARGSSRAK